MLWLPRLTTDRAHGRVALSTASALTLERALLEESLGERASCLESLLAGDPGLLVWSVHQAPSRMGPRFSCCGDVAHWLSGRLAELLQWQADESPQWNETAERTRSYAVGAAKAAAACWLAERLAEADGRLDLRRVQFRALLTAGERWRIERDSAGNGEHGIKAGLPVGPRGEEPSGDPPATAGRSEDAAGFISTGPALDSAYLDLALRACVEVCELGEPRLERSLSSCEGAPSDSPSSIYLRALKQWCTEDRDVGDRLPLLAARLCRLERLESDHRLLVEQEKLAAMKELAYGASHEINNPLANISLRAQMLLRGEVDRERQKALASIHAQAMRAHEMIADLMHFARPPRLTTAPLDLVVLIEQVLVECRPAAARCGVELHHVGPDGPVWIVADAVQLAVALRALCDNAIEAMQHGGHLRVDVRLERHASGRNWTTLQVCDNGPGISAEIRPRIFDPFFSGREAGRGLGFGLSKAWRIVTDHGGSIDVRNLEGGGASFTVRLPVDGPLAGEKSDGALI
jgi:signal transduction histidine kinase